MNQKGFIDIVLLIVIVVFVGTGAYFISMRQTVQPTPTSSVTPTPTPTPTPTKSSNSITLLSPNGGAYILGAKINISWKLSVQASSDATILISLISSPDNSVAGTIASVKATTKGEYNWYGPMVTNNTNQKVAVSGDRYYKIKISLYDGGKLISEDVSDTAFEYAYGGTPLQQ